MTQPLTIYVIQSAHTDIGYTHPQEQIMRMYLEHYERVLALDPHHPLALHNVRKLTGLLNAPLNPESDTLATRPS